ncbi:MAG: metallophosphoesterase, partial [bacterium]|nr:metallophosphoesterase [bacterium]
MNSEAPRRLAVISDIRANLHALRVVIDAVDSLGIRQIVCCGDVVGYGAFPNECVELLRFRRIPTLAGNHDHAALGLTDVKYF